MPTTARRDLHGRAARQAIEDARARGELLTRSEAADYTGVSERTIRRLHERGLFPVVWIGNRALVRRDDLDRYIESRLDPSIELRPVRDDDRPANGKGARPAGVARDTTKATEARKKQAAKRRARSTTTRTRRK